MWVHFTIRKESCSGADNFYYYLFCCQLRYFPDIPKGSFVDLVLMSACVNTAGSFFFLVFVYLYLMCILLSALTVYFMSEGNADTMVFKYLSGLLESNNFKIYTLSSIECLLFRAFINSDSKLWKRAFYIRQLEINSRFGKLQNTQK